MTREEIGLTLDRERRSAVIDLWSRVTLGRYTLMQHGRHVHLVKDDGIVWTEIDSGPPRDDDQRQQNFD